MADQSSIEWTDATWNPITGCTLVSEGCRNCYAARQAAGRLKRLPSRQGLARRNAEGVAKFTGEVRFNREWLTQPLGWTRPRRIFVCAHGDLFAEAVPDAWIDQVFAVMALAPQHTFQVLTKRPQRMREYLLETWQPAPAQTYTMGSDVFDMPAETLGEDRKSQILRECETVLHDLGLDDPDRAALWNENDDLKSLQFGWPLPNVWLGTSVEDQAAADKRIPELLATAAAVRFVSAEPLLGPLNIEAWLRRFSFPEHIDSGGNGHWPTALLDWVIVGGESGPGARPMHPDWARSLRDQCPAGVAFFMKQWGERAEWNNREFSSEEAESLDVQGRYAYFEGHSGAPDVHMLRVGKKRAGRLLDGVEHNGMPAPSPGLRPPSPTRGEGVPTERSASDTHRERAVGTGPRAVGASQSEGKK